MEQNPILKWIECHPAGGGYLTLGAIIAAVWAGWATIHAENKRNEARGRVMAFRLAPTIVNILGDARRARAVLVEIFERPPVTFPNFENMLRQLSIAAKIPPDLFGETWTLPPAIALAVAQLENALTNHDRLAEEFGLGVLMMDEAMKMRTLEAFDASLYAVTRLAEEIKSYCGAVSDRVVRARRRQLWIRMHLLPWNTRR